MEMSSLSIVFESAKVCNNYLLYKTYGCCRGRHSHQPVPMAAHPASGLIGAHMTLFYK